ncbi:globin [Cryobacterium cryoconiti]|uniref:Globin n=1 Tax=Cryobacterium cryoconiti TaxID=1259239 RepID=A0A4Y8JTW6_9MICO|nr:globin [Cryobacterium cryoconiti]TFD27437.1 globin [Cryobacterium cryoconiti]
MTDDASTPLPGGPAPATPGAVHLRDGENGAALGATFYAQVGGRPFFEGLVNEFYRGVATDPVLKPMYPEADLGPAAERLTMFLEQYWGGPGTYSEQRGHPRLRQRHQPFKVNPDARDRWLLHMRAAVDQAGLPPLQRDQLWDYLERAAFAMLNTFDD